MGYVTTNLRLPEEDWEYFKIKALEERKSLSAWIRDSLALVDDGKRIKRKKANWASGLLFLGQNAGKSNVNDLSKNLDKYLYQNKK